MTASELRFKVSLFQSVREGFASTGAPKIHYVEGYDGHPGNSSSNHDLDDLDCFKVAIYI